MNRETIYTALFAKMAATAGIVTASRRLQAIDDMTPAQTPALFLTQGSETAEQLRGLPVKWRLHCKISIYVTFGSGSDAIPSSTLNPIIDAIETALNPTGPDNVQTLGSTVSHCWISGAIEIIEGYMGTEAAAIIPIEILVNI